MAVQSFEDRLLRSSVTALSRAVGCSRTQLYAVISVIKKDGSKLTDETLVKRKIIAALADGPVTIASEKRLQAERVSKEGEFRERALKAKEDRLLTATKRERAELELRHRRGELVEYAIVQRAAVALGHAIRAGIESGRRSVEAASADECRALVVDAFDAAGAGILELAREQILALERVGQR